MVEIRTLIRSIEQALRVSAWADERSHLERVLTHLRNVEGEILGKTLTKGGMGRKAQIPPTTVSKRP